MIGGNNTTIYFDNIEVIESNLKSLTSELIPVESSLTKISIYPNPVIDILKVNVPAKMGERIVVEMFDIQGRPILKNSSYANVDGQTTVEMDVNSVAKGTYLVSLRKHIISPAHPLTP